MNILNLHKHPFHCSFLRLSLITLFSLTSFASDEPEGVGLNLLDMPAQIVFEEDVLFLPNTSSKIFYQNNDPAKDLYCTLILKESKLRKRVVLSKTKFEITSVSFDYKNSKTTVLIQSNQIKEISCYNGNEKKIISTTQFIEIFGKTAAILQNTNPPEKIK